MFSYSKARELNDATYRNYCHTEQRNLALLHPMWIARILAKVSSQATLMTLSPHVSWDPLLRLSQFTSANLLSLVNTSIMVLRQADDLCLKFE